MVANFPDLRIPMEDLLPTDDLVSIHKIDLAYIEDINCNRVKHSFKHFTIYLEVPVVAN